MQFSIRSQGASESASLGSPDSASLGVARGGLDWAEKLYYGDARDEQVRTSVSFLHAQISRRFGREYMYDPVQYTANPQDKHVIYVY